MRAALVFFTNYESAKSAELTAHPQASMLFTWLQLHRQLRVVGTVERASDEESDAYFATRPRSSQLGAWASPQSQTLADRAALDARVAQFEATFAGVDEIPRPAFWGGWRLVAADDRAVAGPSEPPARPRPLPPQRPRSSPWELVRLAP